MLLIRLWHYLKGYVIIIVTGIYAERFINICTRRQILLWDMERLDQRTVRMKMSIRGFKASRTAARKSRCRVRIEAKKGFPYLISRYKKRKGFLAGVVVFAVIIYAMTSIIWYIEITGNNKVGTDVLINQINEMGIYRGAAKRFINPKLVADTLMLKNSELSWVGVEVKGTGLYITVKEGIEPPAIVPYDEPCNVVAKTDGMIISIHAKNGLEMVRKGDTVTKGQVLISGNLESFYPEFGEKQVHAMGEVIARTWYEIKKEIPGKRVTRVRTGKEFNKYSIYFLDFLIPLPSGENPFELFETVTYDKTPVIGNRFRLPFGLTVQNFFEVEEQVTELSSEEARELAQAAAVRELNARIPEDAEVVDQQMQITKENRKEYITVIMECVEDIAMEQEFGGN
ncbi:MAG: sporulation protein YqfD [Clostridiaceae bacterium]|nr:sporulation protein YqfD [Clostridiaceae bacterium]